MIVKVLNYEYMPELQNKSSQAYKDMERNFTCSFPLLPYFLADNDSYDDDDDDDKNDNDDDNDDNDYDDKDDNDLFNYRHLAASPFFRFLCQLFICPSFCCLFVNSIYHPAILVKSWSYLAELQNET